MFRAAVQMAARIVYGVIGGTDGTQHIQIPHRL